MSQKHLGGDKRGEVDAAHCQRPHPIAELLMPDGTELFVQPFLPVGTHLWTLPDSAPKEVWLLDPLPILRSRCLLPEHHARLKSRAAPILLEWLGKSARALLVSPSAVTRRLQQERRYPLLRITGGEVEQFFTEGGWEHAGFLFEPHCRQKPARVDAEAVRRAIGHRLPNVRMMDADDVRLVDLSVTRRGDGTFEVSFCARGVLREAGTFRGRSLFDTSSRESRIGLRWTSEDGDPRQWLLTAVPRLALGADAAEWMP